MPARRLAGIGPVAILLALLSAPSVGLAYEHRTIDAGKYDVVVGWDTEPAFVNQRNAAGIRISKAGTNPAEPVVGADKTLKIQIAQGSQTRTFDLRPVPGQPGYYLADLLPTRAGEYVWTFSGSIGADAIDETFTSADGKLGAVAASSDVAFPVAAPDPDQVGQQLQAAQAAADRAQRVAYLGVAVGVLGVALALAAWFSRRDARRRTSDLSRANGQPLTRV